jgi:hypothetical protein
MPSKKYATPEEAKEAKRLKTLESNRRKREEKKSLAPPKPPREVKENKARAKPRAKVEPESESDIDDDEFERMLLGTPVAEPAIPVSSGFHDLIAFLEQDHGEVIPAASKRPHPQEEVQAVARELAKAHSENIQKAEAKQESVLPAYPIEEKKQISNERVQRDIVAERRKAFHEKVIANRIAKQAELRGEKVHKGNIVWGESPKYTVDDNWVKPPVSPPFPNAASTEPLYSEKGYENWLKQPQYEAGNLQPRVPKKSRFTNANPTEHFNQIVEHFKTRRQGDLRDHYGRPEYGNLKPPVLNPKPKLSLLHPTQIEHITDDNGANIQRILREEARREDNQLLNLITRARTPRVTPKAKPPKAPTPKKVATPKKATPKAKSEPTLKTVLSSIKDKGKVRSDEAQMKTRLKRLETSLKNGKNIEKKQAEIETLKLQIKSIADTYVKQHKERLEKLGAVAPSEVVKRRNKQLADLGEKVRADEIKAKNDARVAKKVAAEQAKANKKLAKQGIVVLGEIPKYKSYQQIVDEQKLEQIQAQGPVIPTEEEEAFVKYFRDTYGSIPQLYKPPVERLNAKPDYRQRGETFATYKGKKVYKWS